MSEVVKPKRQVRKKSVKATTSNEEVETPKKKTYKRNTKKKTAVIEDIEEIPDITIKRKDHDESEEVKSNKFLKSDLDNTYFISTDNQSTKKSEDSQENYRIDKLEKKIEDLTISYNELKNELKKYREYLNNTLITIAKKFEYNGPLNIDAELEVNVNML